MKLKRMSKLLTAGVLNSLALVPRCTKCESGLFMVLPPLGIPGVFKQFKKH